MNLDYEKLLAEDHELTDIEREMIIVAYHKQVVEWFMDGIVFPVIYFIAIICVLNGFVKVYDMFLK